MNTDGEMLQMQSRNEIDYVMANANGGSWGARGVVAKSEAKAQRVAARRQTSGQGQGDQQPPAKKARRHAAGAGREVRERSGMDPGDWLLR